MDFLRDFDRRRAEFDRLLDFMDSSEEEEQEHFGAERRQYKMDERIDMSKWDDTDFMYRFRLSKDTVARVLQIIEPSLVHTQERSRYVRPIAQLLIALRFYALYSMQVSIGDFAGICTTSVSVILQKVTLALAKQRPNFVKMPRTEAEMIAASKRFYGFARFPRTIGAIDCTHIKIQSPGGDEAENFRNRKGWFSLNVQVVCSADMKIVNIVARWPGATHDQTIFNNSNLKMQLERGDFGNFIIVGDSGYRNTHFLATPLLNCESAAHQLYNESQIRTRSVIERTFGVLKRRFPVLSMGMRVKLETVKLIVVACAVLHNIATDSKEPVPPNNIEGFEDLLAVAVIPQVSNEQNAPSNVRDRVLLNYFRTLANSANNNE